MTSHAAGFTYTQDELKALGEIALRHARSLGATDTVTKLSEGGGLSVTVRRGKPETIEHHRGKSMGITVSIGDKSGHASTSDFSKKAIQDTVSAAYQIARFTAEDPFARPPEAELLETAPPDLDLFHEWTLSVGDATKIAQKAEEAAFSADSHIKNSEGATVSTDHSHFVMMTSQGFSAGYPYSQHYIACTPIAESHGKMQCGNWYSSKRHPAELGKPEDIGHYAAQRTLARLNAQSLSTRTCPVLFEAPLAAGLIGAFVQATSGGALYRKHSFLLDSIGKAVFPPHISLYENPHVPRGMGSSPFDSEGVKTQPRHVVKDGILKGYFLSSYTGRKLGLKTTGNAGGSHNLNFSSALTHKNDRLEAMLKKLDTGLFVTELMGNGVNYVTGDYSRGAAGFWVQGGKIQFPVEEITISGNLCQMFKNIVGIGSDVFIRGNKQTGSILIEEMVIAGQSK